jgi:hypothetical protein
MGCHAQIPWFAPLERKAAAMEEVYPRLVGRTARLTKNSGADPSASEPRTRRWTPDGTLPVSERLRPTAHMGMFEVKGQV